MEILEVYVKSETVPPDIESYRHHRMHSHCAPGLAQETLRMPGFSGRLLEQASSTLLQALSVAQGRLEGQVEVYDVGRLRGRLKALTAGVWKTPAVIVDGEKHVGLTAAKEALRNLSAEGADPPKTQ
ncbi:MAG: hypothetical protein PVH62_00365 [Anaerolineae bacterium]